MSYITLRSSRYDNIVPNKHAPTEDKANDTKHRLCEELERVFHQLSKYHMKILLGDFNARRGREIFFKLIIGNEVLHDINNYNGVTAVNFTTFKNLIAKTTFPYRNFHKFTYTYNLEGKTYTKIAHSLIDRRQH
jgi:hypothetical protein